MPSSAANCESDELFGALVRLASLQWSRLVIAVWEIECLSLSLEETPSEEKRLCSGWPFTSAVLFHFSFSPFAFGSVAAVLLEPQRVVVRRPPPPHSAISGLLDVKTISYRSDGYRRRHSSPSPSSSLPLPGQRLIHHARPTAERAVVAYL